MKTNAPMQTVKFNKRALAVLLGILLFFFGILSYVATSGQRSTNPLYIRDAQIRQIVGQQQEHDDLNRVKPPEVKDVVAKLDNGKVNISKSAEAWAQEISEAPRLVLKPPQDEAVNEPRRKFVIKMMQHAWEGYKNYSWGKNEVKPVAMQPNSQAIFGGGNMPATIVDAADTLWIMGLKDEYKEARDFIRDNFDMSLATGALSVFETNIRFLGGLLALYALTGEEFYIEKSRQVGEALLPAFNTPSGIPKSNLDVKTKYASNYGWASGGASILAEFGSLHLEFLFLAKITKSPIFAKKIKTVRDRMDKIEKPGGLYPNYVSPDTGRFVGSRHISLGAMGDSFYEYLIKSWLQSNKTDDQAKKMYWDVSAAIQRSMVMTSKSGLKYVAELRDGRIENKMGHLACFCVGMFALQAVNEYAIQEKNAVMSLAEELGKTCHESYVRSESHIGPEMFYFNHNEEATSRNSENGYILRPEVIEGWFYLWRLTGKQMYREWVWDAINSIEKHCRVEHGYTGLSNVYNPSQGRDDVQQSFFLAETLKYAYLTFTDSSVIDLDKWVFNTEAHPLPVMSANDIKEAYGPESSR